MMTKSTLKIAIIINILISFLSAHINAQQVKFSEQKKRFTKVEMDSLFFQTLSVLPEHKVPIEYRSKIIKPSSLTCATVVVTAVRQNLDLFSPEQQAILRKILQRPILPLSFISSTGRFKIHYTETGVNAVPLEDLDGRGLPDFVEEVAKAFEKSHQVEVTALGYRNPPSDNFKDGPEYDVYIEDLGSRLYGFTQGEDPISETPQNDLVNYIVIDNDFSPHYTKGIRGAKVTAAHEYFHAIQFGYRTFLQNERFYYELSSVWMEDVVYDDINDYYQYLPTFFQGTDIPFNMFDALGHYLGEALWNHFLVKKYQENGRGFGIIQRTWELMQSDVLVLDAIDQALKEIGSSFNEDFADFARWNYFTGSRADSIIYYDEGRAYNEITINGDFQITTLNSVNDASFSLTHKYYKFTTLLSGEYSISGQLENPANWRFGAITNTPESNTTFYIFNLFAGQNLGFLPAPSEIIVIPINIQIDDFPSIESSKLSLRFDLKQSSLDFPVNKGIYQIYPNPFIIGKNQRIFFDFVSVENEEIVIRVFSSDGRVVKTANFADDSGFISRSTYIWDGTNNRGDFVSSGIYIIQLKQGDFRDIKKFAVIRK